MAMLEARELATSDEASDRIVLPFEVRRRSRFRATLELGDELGVFLPRGTVLRGGDVLLASGGRTVEVVAAPEAVSTVAATDGSVLARIAYHLGNRHVPVQVGAGFVRYQRDHVLDAMVRGLGGAVTHEDAPFEPESGAYRADGAAS